jgi:uncharacterized membrane protein YfcA
VEQNWPGKPPSTPAKHHGEFHRLDKDLKHDFKQPRHDQDFHSQKHKVLFPLDQQDYFGLALAVVGLIIAAGGGIGGGGILVPCYILALRFNAKYAIPLSNITIFGGSIVNVWQNYSKRHPTANRPLVDWNLILVMEPMTIAGALVGSFLNKVLPTWFITLMLVLVLGATGQKTVKKGRNLWLKESAEFEKAAGKTTGMAATANAPGGYGATVTPAEEELELIEKAKEAEPENEALKQILLAESVVPLDKVRKLVIIFLGVLCLEIARGGGAYGSIVGVKCGEFGWWVLAFLTIPWIGWWTVYVRHDLVRMYHFKKKHNYQYAEGDTEWDEENTVKYPLICSGAGLCAGMFGIGGGIVKGPLMLAMGVHPAVAAATSACMIFFTTFTACVQFVVFGLMQMDYAAFLFLVGIGATYVGQVVMDGALKRTGRFSVIVLSIGIVVSLSAVFMGIEGMLKVGTEGASNSTICSKA